MSHFIEKCIHRFNLPIENLFFAWIIFGIGFLSSPLSLIFLSLLFAIIPFIFYYEKKLWCLKNNDE